MTAESQRTANHDERRRKVEDRDAVWRGAFIETFEDSDLPYLYRNRTDVGDGGSRPAFGRSEG